ncbi:MAG: GNAT family N-acetyltransferase [Chitinivibrionales bacterium]|nr:GNAT family N-acetyltransferase [Chitinivibrionales bacterium]MBD3394990.1 GNAT family N-acetyltransferase [Chitinivibrionales bacterium]
MASWQELYESKKTSASKAIGRIRPGARIFIGTGCGQPQILVDELVSDRNDIVDAEVYHLLTRGQAPYIREEYARKFRTCSFFLAPNVREGIVSGRGDYIPIGLSDIPSLFYSGRIPIDVALIQTSPPDKNGYLSLGISVDIVKSAVENSLTVIAEVNEKMPRTLGDTFIPVDMVEAVVESDRDVLEYSLPESDHTIDAIARNVASLIDDGSTVEVGIGTIPQAVLRYLREKNDLGVHTEMFNDAIVPLVEEGIINGKRKTINRGRVVASFCLGTRRLYDYIHENQMFDFRPTEYVNDPFVISQHRRMVAINVAIEVDMTGQVCSDSIGYDFYSGIGGQLDFNRGAARARDGKAIIALPSTAKGGTISRIVPRLTEGAGVVVPRGDVRYVVTEYGIADLFGRNIRERVLSLAEIAHPDFRNEILKEGKKRRYVFAHQKERSPESWQYPREFETRRTLADGTAVLFRPVKPTDDHALRDMCYALSEKSIAFRFFQPIKAFPHKFVQEFTSIDYSTDMAIAATIQDMGGESIVGVGHYFLNRETNRAELSFLVRDDWQAKGIGTLLFEILVDIARRRGVKGFEASVLASNAGMLNVFFNSGFEVSTKREEDMFVISFDLDV